MSRNTRLEYAETLPRPKLSKRQLLRVIKAVGMPPEPQAEKPRKQPKAKKRWSWRVCYTSKLAVFAAIYGGQPPAQGPEEGVVEAYTRSEARAEIKKQLGISRHRRLPDHIEIRDRGTVIA